MNVVFLAGIQTSSLSFIVFVGYFLFTTIEKKPTLEHVSRWIMGKRKYLWVYLTLDRIKGAHFYVIFLKTRFLLLSMNMSKFSCFMDIVMNIDL